MFEALLWWLLVLLSGTAVFLRFFKWFRIPFHSIGERLVFAAALGMGFWSYAVFAMGSAGRLQKPLFILLILLLIAFNRQVLFESFSEGLNELRAAARGLSGPWPFVLALLVIVVAFFAFAGALAPPTGQDELCYHLQQPKLYVHAGSVYEVPYSTNSLWPYLMEMLFTLGLLLKGAGLAKLFHFATFIGAAFAIDRFGVRAGQARAGRFGALIYFFTPAVFIQSAFAYVDNGLALYVFLCLYAFYVFSRTKENGWAVLAGLCGGLAVSTKYIGLFIGPILALFFVWFFARAKGGRLQFLKGAAYLVVALAAAGALWYVRAWMLRGNPVFPFAHRLFGHGWHDATYVDAHGRGKSPLAFLLLAWDTAMRPAWFGGEPLGPAYLLFLPLIFITGKKSGGVVFMGAAGLLFTALWFGADPNIRFFFPALACFAVVAGAAMEGLLSDPAPPIRIFWKAAVIFLFTAEAAFAFHHFHDAALLLAGRISERSYLSSRVPSYEAARTINAFLSPEDRILSTGENRGYYFENPFTLEGDLRNMTGYDKAHPMAAETIKDLKNRGFTVVLASSLEAAGERRDEGWTVERILGDPASKNDFFQNELIVKSGEVRYALYRIR